MKLKQNVENLAYFIANECDNNDMRFLKVMELNALEAFEESENSNGFRMSTVRSSKGRIYDTLDCNDLSEVDFGKF